MRRVTQDASEQILEKHYAQSMFELELAAEYDHHVSFYAKADEDYHMESS